MGTVLLEDAGRCKFPKFVADHVFRHEDRNEGTSVVNVKGVPDKIRSHRGTAGPGFDRFLDIAFVELVDLLEELPLDERAFF